MASKKLAHISVMGPDGEGLSQAELTAERIVVGRPVPGSRPNVALEPDPQCWVSRAHCFLEREGGAWWVSDNSTPNGTFLRRREQLERVQGRQRLEDGDVICIVGDMTSDGPRHWELAFTDPFATRRAETRHGVTCACLEYDWIQARIFRLNGAQRREIANVPGKAHQLIRYLVHRSDQNEGSPVACTHDELIRAVWGEPAQWRQYRTYTRENLRDLVSDLRQQLEPDPAHPCILQTVPGIGYRLVTCPSTRPVEGDWT